MSRPKRRQDGTLRPTILRQRAKRARARRVAWLAQFAPGERSRFFDAVDMEQAVFAGPAARKLGKSEEETELILERFAERMAWMTLRTRSGRVVGIGPRKP